MKRNKIIIKSAKPDILCKCGKPADFAIKLIGRDRGKGYICASCFNGLLERIYLNEK